MIYNSENIPIYLQTDTSATFFTIWPLNAVVFNSCTSLHLCISQYSELYYLCTWCEELILLNYVTNDILGLYVQVGIAEMKVAIERTGGLVVLAESFGHSVFKDSFRRVFEGGELSLGLCFK